MKILIHSTTLDGEPLDADSIALEGKNCAELVEIMKGQTPFTIEAIARDYMLGVLGRIEPDRKIQLPEDPETAAAEFLTLLGKHGLVEFLPDDAFIDLPPEAPLPRRMIYVRTSRHHLRSKAPPDCRMGISE